MHPTVRSQVSASFLAENDFDYRIADVTTQDGAETAVGDADIVAIAAFSTQYARSFEPRRARTTNEALIENAVRQAPRDATIVYFSSIATFGDEVGFSNWDSYGREKRHSESVFADACEDSGKEGYALRMGPIYGPNQNTTRELERQLALHRVDGGEVHVAVAPEKGSNVLHTVTVMDAIITCSEESLDRDVYTLVNVPRWSWEEVLDRYAPEDSRIVFHGTSDSDGSSVQGKLVSQAKRMLESRERTLRAFSVHLPDRVNHRIFNEYAKRNFSGELAGFDRRKRFRRSQFDESPAPGPFIEELTETCKLLDEEDAIRPAFQPNDIE